MSFGSFLLFLVTRWNVIPIWVKYIFFWDILYDMIWIRTRKPFVLSKKKNCKKWYFSSKKIENSILSMDLVWHIHLNYSGTFHSENVKMIWFRFQIFHSIKRVSCMLRYFWAYITRYTSSVGVIGKKAKFSSSALRLFSTNSV